MDGEIAPSAEQAAELQPVASSAPGPSDDGQGASVPAQVDGDGSSRGGDDRKSGSSSSSRDRDRDRDRDRRDRDRGERERDGERDRKGDRERERERDRDRSDRGDREREREKGDRDRGDRDRERERERGERDRERERSERDRERERTEKRGSSKKKSRSRSPSPKRTETKRKRVSLWDKAPTGFIGGQVVSLPQAALNPHQSRQARRLYVGNIPPGVTDLDLANFINTAMATAGVTKNGNAAPVIAVQMNHEKNFAFIEFDNPEDATAGMGFDGISLAGHSLKVRRPKDYRPVGEADTTIAGLAPLPPVGGQLALTDGGAGGVVPVGGAPTPMSQALVAVGGVAHNPLALGFPSIVSTNVQESPHKIFIGGLPSYLNEEQVKELVSSFGQLKSFNLVKDNVTGNSKGFAFFDYLDPDVTDRACLGLNGMKLGEKTILVQRANVGARQHIQLMQANPTGTSYLVNQTALNFLNLSMPIAAAAALLQININEPGAPTRVLQLMNLVNPERLTNDVEYNEILEDVIQECSKHGTVVSAYIPRPLPNTGVQYDAEGVEIQVKHQKIWGVGKVFVEFKRKEEAEKALKALGGRRFDNRSVMAGYYSEEKYAQKDFAPSSEEERVVADRFQKQHELNARVQAEQELEDLYQETEEDKKEREALASMTKVPEGGEAAAAAPAAAPAQP